MKPATIPSYLNSDRRKPKDNSRVIFETIHAVYIGSYRARDKSWVTGSFDDAFEDSAIISCAPAPFLSRTES